LENMVVLRSVPLAEMYCPPNWVLQLASVSIVIVGSRGAKDKTEEVLNKAGKKSDIIQVLSGELEFLLNHESCFALTQVSVQLIYVSSLALIINFFCTT
jgi:hypothetical protein